MTDTGRVTTNTVNMSVAKEESGNFGQVSSSAPRINLQPNSINQFGAEITTTVRNPIDSSRQREKGTTTDLESSLEFEHDLIFDVAKLFAPSFAFVKPTNSDLQFTVNSLNASTSSTTITVDETISATAIAKLTPQTNLHILMHADDFSINANNGVYPVDAAPSGNDVVLTTSADTTEDETVPTDSISKPRLNLAGARINITEADVIRYNSSSRRVILGKGDNSGSALATVLNYLDDNDLIKLGQLVHFGGSGLRGLFTTGDVDNNDDDVEYITYGRIIAINKVNYEVRSIEFDKLSFTPPGFTDAMPNGVDTVMFGAAGQTQSGQSQTLSYELDILFGQFVRNVTTSDPDYIEDHYTFELDFPGLFGNDSTTNAPISGFQYSIGNYCNTMEFSLPLTEKATINFGFMGTDTKDPVEENMRTTGFDSAKNFSKVTLYNTTADIARLRLEDVDEAGLTTDFKSLTLTLNNNVNPEKVLGTLGARFVNAGNFEVNLETQVLFTNGEVVNAIRNNETLSLDFILHNEDGIIAVDIPAMTISGGGRDFPENETVLINITGQAHRHETLNTSIGISLFSYGP